MSNHLIRAATIATGLALIFTATALGSREVVRAGNLFLVDSGGISPRKLPRHESVPIRAHIAGEIGTVDGSHPPAVRTVTVDIDRTIQLNAVGLPTCRLGQISVRTTAAATKACAGAKVGSGEGEVEVAFPDQLPFSAKGPIVIFNGGVHDGTTILLIHAYVAVPAPTAIVTTIRITHTHRGQFGLHAVARIPRITGGAGSVTRFELNLGRRFTYRGERKSYLMARCPTGHYRTRGEVLFGDGSKLGVDHLLPCTPKG